MNYSKILEKYKSYDLKLDENGCILAGIEAYPPFTTYDGKNFGGTCLELFTLIMKKLELCFTLVKSPNGLFGEKFPNDTWTGLIGLVQRKEVEMIVCPLSTVYNRYKIVDFSEPVVSSTYSLVYPRPTVKPNYAGLVMPFNYPTWVMIFISLMCVTGFSFIKNKVFAPNMMGQKISKSTPTKIRPRIPNEVWFKGMIGQPTPKLPKDTGNRLLVALWLLVMLVLITTYKCNLKAQLICPMVYVPFNNLDELITEKKHEWSFLKGSIIGQYFEPAFESDPNSIMGIGWKERSELYTNGEQISHFVLEKELVCIAISARVDALFSEDFTKTGKCRLATARDKVFQVQMTFGLKKKSKFAYLINPIIRRLREFGIIQKIFSKNTVNATHCKVPPGKEDGITDRSLTLVDFQGLFGLLLAGYGMATIVLICEIIRNY